MYLCIDLKSFYASAECADLGLDPFKVNLVVADESRGRGALCLAATPAIKALGVKNRCRLFEIPPGISYMVVKPRMRRYMEVSAKIYETYLKYLSKDDIYVYSIDECFIDTAPYGKMYGENAKDMARMLMGAGYDATHISSAAGVGTNLFLAKIALDIVAKHAPDRIGVLNEMTFRRDLWRHRPITDFWNIAGGIAGRLAKYGIHDLYGVAHFSPAVLKKEFGVNAELLIDHAWGRESATIADIHAYRPKSRSLNTSQVLFEDYSREDAKMVMEEMAWELLIELIEKNLVCRGISLYVGYSKQVHGSSGGTRKFPSPTDVPSRIMAALDALYDEKVQPFPIRHIGISFNDTADCREPVPTDLFASPEKEEKERNLLRAVARIRERYGKDAIFRAAELCEKSTALRRHHLIGGHNA